MPFPRKRGLGHYEEFTRQQWVAAWRAIRILARHNPREHIRNITGLNDLHLKCLSILDERNRRDMLLWGLHIRLCHRRNIERLTS